MGTYHSNPDGSATIFTKEDVFKDNSSNDRTWTGLRPGKDMFRVVTEKHSPTLSGVSNKELDGVPLFEGTYAMSHIAGFSESSSSQDVAIEDDLPTWGQGQTEMISRSNPGRPYISLPVMAAEMLELTSLFRVTTKTLATTLGSTYLNYKFGWATLVSDLRKFRSITKVVESRIREFNSLVQYGSFSRELTLGKARTSKEFGLSYIYNVGNSKVKGIGNRTVKSDMTGYIRYVPTLATFEENLLPLEPVEHFNIALRHVLDLDELDPDTIWEAIPFSWLVDYFYEIGPYLEATNNDFKLKIEELTLTKASKEIVTTIPKTWSSKVDAMQKTQGQAIQYRVKRKAWNNFDFLDLRPNWNLLNPSQITTILALLASRSK
jgi:hypothetical protein